MRKPRNSFANSSPPAVDLPESCHYNTPACPQSLRHRTLLRRLEHAILTHPCSAEARTHSVWTSRNMVIHLLESL